MSSFASTLELDIAHLFYEVEFKAVTEISQLDLTRNVGSQKSIAIGLAYVAEHQNADYLIVADSDYQDKPEDMPRLLQACVEGKDNSIIFAKRSKRSESVPFRIYYYIYQLIFKVLTDTQISMGSFSASPWKYVPRLVQLAELVP